MCDEIFSSPSKLSTVQLLQFCASLLIGSYSIYESRDGQEMADVASSYCVPVDYK